ncbi:hypothetical protein CCP4SC76_1700011 [Gammaproteobacteria bacterium]
MQIMISVLRSDTSKEILNRYMDDFDEYVYDEYVHRASSSEMSPVEIKDPALSKVEAEVTGGYLACLRNVPNSRNGEGYLVSYRPDFVCDASRCKLKALSNVFLFGGRTEGRQTIHFVGEKTKVMELLERIVQNEERRGLVSDIADCLDACRNHLA